jgi:uncharacterized membrane protein
MSLLILGLTLFILPHSTRIFSDAWRTAMMARIGERPWKGAISLISLAGFALIVIGYGQARLDPVVLWTPPVALRHLALLLNLVAFISLVAAYVPRNSIKSKIGHPMIVGVKAWAIAHLLANGNLEDLVLFGAFLAWAIVDFRHSRRHDRTHHVSYPAGTLAGNLLTVVIGIAAWAVFMLYLHVRLIGVAPIALGS